MTMRKTLTAVLIAGVALAAAAGCGSKTDDSPNADDKSSASASAKPTRTATPTPTLPPAKTADPPLKFDKAAGVDLPFKLGQGNLAGDVTTNFTTLSGRTAYIVSAYDLSAVDLISAKQLWKTPIEGAPADPNAQAGPFVNDAGPRPPLVSEDGKTVYGAFPVTVPGKGTTPSHFAVVVMAVGAEKGDVEWSALVDAPDPDTNGDRAITRVLGVTDQAVVVTYTTTNAAETFAIAPNTKEPLWEARGLIARSLNGDVVVGISDAEPGLPSQTRIVGVGLTDGKERWVAAETWSGAVENAGPDTAMIAYVNSTGDETMAFVDPATGKPKQSALARNGGIEGLSELGECQYDQKSIMVCQVGGEMSQMMAFDASTGKQLWALPKDKNDQRQRPGLSAVWHGAIYGTTSNGPIVLDGQTGADKEIAPGIAPDWVSEYGGIASSVDGADGPVAYPVAE
ncbi:PQQ-binding-like beta-propeller repeat protein [Flindersiella endophytica]